jgi:predicted AlkP superfamily phosphohydrolase/phosphomutase
VIRAFLVALSIFVTACAGQRTPQYHQKLVILGIDGLDPDLVSQFIDQGKLPNIQKLSRQGALQRLETTPSPDASAWASFATGTNPGKHGVFGNETRPVRHGADFWTLAGQAGVRSSVLTVPLTFPPEEIPNGELLSGWPLPDLRDTPGTFTYFASDIAQKDDGSAVEGGIRRRLTFDGDVAHSAVAGPLGLSLPISIFWNRAGKSATVEIDGTSIRLEEGEWSKWIHIDFGTSRFARLFSGEHGMIEFCLARAGTTFRLYASPVNWRPDRPPARLSSPAGFAADVFERVGPYRTLGWAEATAALDAGLIDEKAFMDDVYRAFDDRMQIILQRLDTKKWDLLVGEIDSLDHVQHVMWRLMDPAHPAHDRAAALRFGDAIEHMYRRCDDLVGEVMKHADADTVVLVMSAYGEHGLTQTFDLNRWLSQEQLPGKATATGAGGIFLSPEAHGAEEHLIARLTALLDPVTKAPVISAAYRREAVYTGPYVSNAPDVQVGFAPGYGVGSTATIFAPNQRKWSADHASIDYKGVPGTLIASRPTRADSPRVIDIAPTVLRYFGVPIPSEIDGTPLF